MRLTYALDDSDSRDCIRTRVLIFVSSISEKRREDWDIRDAWSREYGSMRLKIASWGMGMVGGRKDFEMLL